MYPSVSVCKKYAFDLTSLDFEYHENQGVNTFISWLKEYSVRMEDQFYFFTLPGVENLTFPCTTKLGGMTPGRPCVFPIYWYGSRRDQCFKMDTQSPACLTKIFNGGYVEEPNEADYFGYCPSNCTGETIGPNSPYNLAALKHEKFWNSYFYDLSSYENGYCHTFNPPKKSDPGLENRMYFMINDVSAYLSEYDIFLHENGQFWPRSDMFSIGQHKPVKVGLNSDVEITFTVKKITNINKPTRPCIERDDYSFTKCLQKFAVKKTNCSFDYTAVNLDQQRSCSTEHFLKYFKHLIWIKQSRLSDVIEESGCHPKCKITEYSYETNEQNSSWTSNWTAEIYIQPESSITENSVEYYTFDFSDLIGNIGGNLGLFLGWSLLTFVEALAFLLCIFKMKNNGTSIKNEEQMLQ